MTSEIQRLEGKLDAFAADLSKQMGGLAVDMAQLKSSVMQRPEIEAADARRVALDTYASDQRATNERLIRLESSPTRLLAWVSGGIGCLGVIVSITSVAVFILEFVLTHYKP